MKGIDSFNDVRTSKDELSRFGKIKFRKIYALTINMQGESRDCRTKESGNQTGGKRQTPVGLAVASLRAGDRGSYFRVPF